jgi:ferredoxin
VNEEVRDFGMVISTDCMKTMACIEVCPNEALRFSFGTPAIFKKRRAKGKESKVGVPTWPEEILLVLFFAAGFFATEGLYGRVSFLLALAIGMVTSIFALQLKRAFTSANYRPGPKPWRLQKKWQPHGLVKVALLLLFMAVISHSAWVQKHSRQRDAAFGQTLGYRNAWLQGQANLPAPSSVHEASIQALRATEFTESYGLLFDPRDSFVRAWDRLFQGDVDGFELGLLGVLEQRPGFGEVLFQLGRHQSLMGRSGEAVESWAQVSPRDPRYFDVRRDMILDLDALGRSQEADVIHAELLQRGYPEEALQGRLLPDENGHSR